jgi:hypothetical protein
MSMMKRIIYGLLVGLIATQATSCKKSIDAKPVDQFSDVSVWKDPALVETFVNNIYGGIPHGFSNMMMASYVDETQYNADFGQSNVTKSLITSSDLSTFSANYWTSFASRYRNWSNIYRYVRPTNIFFQNINSVTFENQEMKNRLIGEVHFLRAYLYHNAMTMYGGVPIITKAFGLGDDYEVARNTFAETVQFISDECDSAAAYLPMQMNSSNQGRATKGAAMALKARTLLYAASDLYNTDPTWAGGYANKELIGYFDGNRTARWQAAKDAAKAVIDLNIYSLHGQNPATKEEATQNYADVFLKSQTSEDIFSKYFTTRYDESWDGYNPGLYNNPNGWHGWGSNTPIGQMVDAYEMEDGTEFSWSNAQHAADPYENRDPRFYASINYNGAKWRPRPADVAPRDPIGIVQTGFWEKWNTTTNTTELIPGLDTRKSPIEDWNGTYTGYFLRKFLDPTVDAQFTKQTQPWRYIRYAEVLLNYAEASLGLGDEAEAKTYINMIRKRAGMPDITEAGPALVERYRNERRVELAFEDHRFIDVRRWLIAPEAYTNAEGVEIRYKLLPDKTTATKPTFTVITAQERAWNPRFYFLPIAKDEMNRNSKLIQNPLYD